MRPSIIRATKEGPSGWHHLNRNAGTFQATLALSTEGQATATVEFTLATDLISLGKEVPADQVYTLDESAMPGVFKLDFPVGAVRVNVSGSDGDPVMLRIIQTG